MLSKHLLLSTISLTWAYSVLENIFKFASSVHDQYHHLVAFAIWGVLMHYIVSRVYQIFAVAISGEATTILIGLKIILGYYDLRSVYLFFHHP